MAFRLRIHTFITPRSLLHHRLLATSSSAAGGDGPNCFMLSSSCSSPIRIPTLTEPCLLHHHRLFSTSSSSSGGDSTSHSVLRDVRDVVNRLRVWPCFSEEPEPESSTSGAGGEPSPSVLRELREALKLISVWPIHSNQAEIDALRDSSISEDASELDKKLHQIKLSVLSVRQRQADDHRRLLDMDHSKLASVGEIHESLPDPELLWQLEKQTVLVPRMREKFGNLLDAMVTGFTRMKEMEVEFAKLIEKFTNSRVASMTEIQESLYDMKKDLKREVWKELHEGLEKGKKMEGEEFKLVNKNFNRNYHYCKHHIEMFSEKRRNL